MAQTSSESAQPTTRQLILITLGVMASTFAGFVDQTIVSTAGPTIISALGGLGLYTWVYSAFLITATAAMPIFGKLSDRYGRKRFFILGSLVFIVGSMLSGLSQNIYQLIVFRALQGLGSGAIIPVLFGLIAIVFPKRLVVRVQGFLFATVGFATVVGPSIGSYLVEYSGWRWVFYFNIPVGILSIAAILIGLKESRSQGPKPAIDWTGIFSLLAWSVLLLFGLLDGGSVFPWYSRQEAATFGAAATVFVFFVFNELRAEDPVIPPSLLKVRTVSASLAVGLLRQTTFFAAIIYAPLFVQAALGGSVSDGRNALYALALPFIVGSLLSGQFITRGTSYRTTVFVGLVSMIAGIYGLTFLGSTSTILAVMGSVAPVGFGAGLTISATLNAITNSVERPQIGLATSLLTFMLFLGSSIGLAILGSVQNNAFSSRLSSVLSHVPAQGQSQAGALLSNPNMVGNLLATPQALAAGVATNPYLAALVPALRSAFALSLTPVCWFVLGQLMVGLVACVFIQGSLRAPPMLTPAKDIQSIPGERQGAI